jgi:predicted naringenin-chalcone synthase
LVVNTCTGYLCPGLSSYILEKLGLPRNIRTYDLVGGGCGGAIPNLQAAQEFLRAGGKGAALCVAVEICSATFQMADDMSLLLSNALFADGAAAAVLWTRPQGLALVDSSNRHHPEDRESIRYVYRNGQLYNQLSRTLPSLVNRAVAQAVADVLAPKIWLRQTWLIGPCIAVASGCWRQWPRQSIFLLKSLPRRGRPCAATETCPHHRFSLPSRISLTMASVPEIGA